MQSKLLAAEKNGGKLGKMRWMVRMNRA
jgi:hypothetical protein